jgi:hypothetical protein
MKTCLNLLLAAALLTGNTLPLTSQPPCCGSLPNFLREWSTNPADYFDLLGDVNSELESAVDQDGNVYVTGAFIGTAFGTLISNGEHDVFVSKYDPNGNLLWSYSFGGPLDDRGTGIRLDQSGNVYLAGIYKSALMDVDGTGTGIPALTNNNPSLANFYLAKCSIVNNAPVFSWAHGIGGDWEDKVEAMTVDDNGNMIATGTFRATVDFDPQNAGGEQTSLSQYDCFTAKYSPAGVLEWMQGIDGGVQARGLDVATTPGGEVLVTGEHTSAGILAPFVTRYDPNGGNPAWFMSLQNTGIPSAGGGFSLLTDGTSFYLGGSFSGSPVNFDPIGNIFAHLNNTASGNDGFFAKYHVSNGHAQWAYVVENSLVLDLAFDSDGNVILTGSMNGNQADMDLYPGAGQTMVLGSRGDKDMIVGLYKPTNASLVRAFNPGGSAKDIGWSVAGGASGSIYLAGRFASADFDADPAGANVPDHDAQSIADVLVAKYLLVCDSIVGNCCDSLAVFVEELAFVDSCCYTVDLTNNIGLDITRLEAVLGNNDWIFTNVIANSGMGFLQNSGSNDISLTHTSGNFPGGTTNNALTFCLSPLSSNASSTQTIFFHWWETLADGTEQIVCSDTVFTHCETGGPACATCPGSSTAGPNLVDNGDFSGGDTGFMSDYDFVAAGNQLDQGDYSVRNSTNLANGNWTCMDHTSGQSLGLFLVCDGSLNSNEYCWRTSIATDSGQIYTFCVFVNNLTEAGNNHNEPEVEVKINGTAVATAILPEMQGPWTMLTSQWLADASFAVLEIRSLSSEDLGNDFAIDDVAFQKCTQPINEASQTLLHGDIKLFPNPATSELHLVFGLPLSGEAGLRLFDVWGRVLQEASLSKGATQYDFDLSALPAGVYWIDLGSDDGRTWRSKIIKQ